MLRRAFLLFPLTLLGCVAQTAPSTPLSGTEWQFVTIDGQAPASDKTVLTFSDTALNGSVGCNRLGGPWRIDGDRLIAGPLVQTKMFCSGKVGEQETAVSALLVSAPEITLAGDRLTLHSRGHSAEFERAGSQ